jgi:glucose/mannose-6-phosphate isomerase
MDITDEIIRALAGEVFNIYSEGRTLLARIFSHIYLGDWTSFYLAILNGIDPTPVKSIDFLKRRLAELK